MKIICGTNFSVHSTDAAFAGAALAAQTQGSLTLVNVLDMSRYINPSKDLMEYFRDSRKKQLDALSQRVRRKTETIEARVVEGSPATKLAEMASATGAQLLIVSSNGQIAPTKSFVGSTAEQAVHGSVIPVMVVRKAGGLTDWSSGKRPLRVFVGYDYSPSAEAALRWVASLLDIAPCEITVGYVASASNDRGRLGITPPASPLFYPSGIKAFLASELKQKCDTVFGNDLAKVHIVADWGSPGSHLIEMAGGDRADLIVVGTSQRSGMARLGSVSRAVLHYAPMNVLCVPSAAVMRATPADFLQFNRVLVPVDFTASAKETIAVACASVRDGGEIRLVHVVTPSDQTRRDTTRRDESGDVDGENLSARLEALIPAAAASRGIATRGMVMEHHDPAAAICQAADRFDADLICMGSRDRSRFKETLLGSVSQDVMNRSERAVLVLRGGRHWRADQATIAVN